MTARSAGTPNLDGRQIPAVKAKPQAARMQAAPQQELGLGVAAADAAHVERRCSGVRTSTMTVPQAAASAVIVRSARTNSAIVIPGRIVTAPKRKLLRYSG